MSVQMPTPVLSKYPPTRRSVLHDWRHMGLGGTQADVDRGLVGYAEVVAEALKPVFSPPICPSCFSSFCQIMVHKNSVVALLKTDCHVFWDATMAFVSADWTPERRDSLSRSLRQNGTHCTTCLQHTCCASALPQILALDSLFDYVYQLACTCIYLGTVHGIGGDRGFISTRGRWPTKSEELFPYGPERTMSSLITQLSTHNTCVERVIFGLVSLHRPLAFPVLMQPANRKRVISYLVSRFTACTAEFNAALAKLRQPVLPQVRKALALRYIQMYEPTACLFHAACSGPDSQSGDHLRFWRGHEHALFSAFHDFASLLLDDAIDKYEWMAILGTKLWFAVYEASNGILAGCEGLPPYARGVERLDSLADPYRMLYRYLPARMVDRSCCGPTCGKTVHAKETPGGFARCSMCRAVQYCSRACQKADWTRAAVPHKKVCPALTALAVFVAPDVRPRAAEFSALCAEHEFPLEHVDTLILWASAGKVSPNYAGGAEQTIEMHRDVLGDLVELSGPVPETSIQ